MLGSTVSLDRYEVRMMLVKPSLTEVKSKNLAKSLIRPTNAV